MAAAYAFHLCRNHPFVDGNKRTSIWAMLIFLRINGFTLDAGIEEIEDLGWKLSRGEIDKDGLGRWLETRTR